MGRSSYDGSDFAESEQLVGARRGLVRPEAVRVVSQRAFQPGFPIWTDCRPHDGVHGAARPVGQLVNTSQHVNGSDRDSRYGPIAAPMTASTKPPVPSARSVTLSGKL